MARQTTSVAWGNDMVTRLARRFMLEMIKLNEKIFTD
jgi:hypothetical protein